MEISHTPRIRTNRVFQIDSGAKWIPGNENVTLIKLTKKLIHALFNPIPSVMKDAGPRETDPNGFRSRKGRLHC